MTKSQLWDLDLLFRVEEVLTDDALQRQVRLIGERACEIVYKVLMAASIAIAEFFLLTCRYLVERNY